MLMVKMEKRPLAPEGVYLTQVGSVTSEDHEEYGPRIQFAFPLEDLADEDGRPVVVFRSCSNKLTPRSALRGIVEGILGRKLTEEEVYNGFDLESLVGLPVQIVVKHKVSAQGNTYGIAETIIHVAEQKTENLPF